MKTVKNVCKKCGAAEELNSKDRIIFLLTRLFLVPMLVLGFMFVVFMVIVGPTTAMSSVTTSLMMSFTTDGSHDEIRHEAINWTNHCYPYDQLCYGTSIYEHFDHIPYVQASLISPMQTPEETLEFGGDCKNSAILYTTAMKTVGAHSYVLCSVEEKHCVSIVPDNERNKYYVIDLTIPAMMSMEKGSEPWNYTEEGTVIRWTQ